MKIEGEKMKQKIVVDKLLDDVFAVKESDYLIVTVDDHSNTELIETLVAQTNENKIKTKVFKVDSGITDANIRLLTKASIWLDASSHGYYGSNLLSDIIEVNDKIRFLQIGSTNTDILYKLYGRLDVCAMTGLTYELREMLVAAQKVRVATEKGTDIQYVMDKNHLVVKDDGNAREPGSYIHPAMVNLVPKFGSASGRLVFDAFYAEDVVSGVLNEPLAFNIKDGKIINIDGATGEKEALCNWLEKDGDANAYKVGDNNFGLVPFLDAISGKRYFDERMWGAMNWGFGSVHASDAPPHGQESKLHMDGITTKVSVWIDDVPVMEKGEFIHQKLKPFSDQICIY